MRAGLRRLAGARYARRISVVVVALVVGFAGCFGGLWWRLGAGPINLDIVTPWLAEAIAQNIGNGNTVEVGGTQIERVGIRIAVRVRDIIVRDRDHAIVASAPKAEVKLSAAALLVGRLSAESLNLVDAELSVRITPDGYVTVSAGDTAKPLATGIAKPRPDGPAAAQSTAPATSPPASASGGNSGLLAGLDWLDSLSLTGLDGQNLNEIGLKNGSLVVDDRQRGNTWNFENINLSLRRPSNGGAALSLGEDGARPWSLRVAVGPAENGVRSVDIRADRVSTANILLALRPKDLTLSADLPLSGELRGEVGRDGMPVALSGKITAGGGTINDSDTPDYPMRLDSAEMSVEWDAARHVLVAPLKVVSGANRIRLLARLEPPGERIKAWQLALSGGTIVLGGIDREPALVFDRVSVGVRVDTERKQVLLTQFDISNGETGVVGSASIDYSGEPLLSLRLASRPMSVTALKRIWPALIVPDVREWVVERVARGSVQRVEIGIDTLVKNLPRRGPPIPDNGLSITIVANGVTVLPVDGLPPVHDADLRAVITGRTAAVTVGQGTADTPAGRRLNISDFVFEVPDTHSKPPPARVKMKMDGPVPAAAETLASERLRGLSATMLDPSTSKGSFSASINLTMPVKGELSSEDMSYSATTEVTGFAADKLVMGERLEASALKILANKEGYEVRGDVRINGQAATVDYRKLADGDADIKLSATLDDAGRARLGLDPGSGLAGPIPIRLAGRIGDGDHDSRLGVEADLTALKLDNVLPGWVKVPGKAVRATFNVIPKVQSTRLEDILVEGGGVSIKGSLELDQSGDLLSANFPTYAPSEGDKASLRAERGADGVTKVVIRGDVFDGRGFLKSAGTVGDDSRDRNVDVDLRLGAVAGYNGEALRGVDLKLSRRNGVIRHLGLNGKIGRDTLLSAELKPRGQGVGRDVFFLETNDAGAFLRFDDMYSKVTGGQLELAIDPPNGEGGPREGLMNVRDFTVKGEAALDRAAAGVPGGVRNGIFFSRLHAEFTRQSGQLTIREGVLKGPSVGATIEGTMDSVANQVRMSGTFVPLYGINNMFGQIPIVGLVLGGGSNEGLFGVTYEVVGTPSAPVVRINPLSAMAPGVLRKIFEFNTGKQQNQIEFPPN